MRSGKLLLESIDLPVAEGVDFAIEPPLAGRWLIERIKEWKGQGYEIDLYHLNLSCPETSIDRVRRRVAKARAQHSLRGDEAPP